MDQLTPSSPGWSEWLGQLSGPEYISALKEAGLWKKRPPDIPPPLSYEPSEMRDLNAPLEWWEDAGPVPDRLTIWDPQNANHSPFPSGFKIPKIDAITNARVKRYLAKDVLQVANDDIFPTGDYEISFRKDKKKRTYDVPSKGQAEDPARSLEESKRRAKSKVRDIALCNRFEYMFTWTLDGSLIDRYDNDEVYRKVRDFLSNATRRKNFRYVCIPEYHKQKAGEEKPAIHLHGLCILGDVKIAPSLRKDGLQRRDNAGRPIFNMTDWKWGFSTCVPLDENYERTVNYVTKYITKCDKKIFGKWYLSSRTIKKAPDIIPVERIDFESFRDQEKIDRKEQMETNIYFDVKIVSEEYEHGICSAE